MHKSKPKNYNIHISEQSQHSINQRMISLLNEQEGASTRLMLWG